MNELPISNFASKFPFVIQGFDNCLDKWVDSKHGANTYLLAQKKIEEFYEKGEVFMSRETKSRIARAKSLK